jgi:alcohol dehydrogenase class IV
MQEKMQGPGCIGQLSERIAGKGYKTVFLLAGEHFIRNGESGLPDDLTVRQFAKNGINVLDTEIETAFTAYKEKSEEVLLAIGGGSVIDLAKSIIYRCIETSLAVPYFIAAPTTAGSGSEATQFAVVYKNGKKISLLNPSLLPSMVVLDPTLTYSLASFQTAASGMDTLSQAIESFWSVHATDVSVQYAAESIQLWQEYFLRAVKDPDPSSRQNMLYAAHLAGKAINETRTTGPHALSYYLTAEHGVAHGQAVSVFLPVFFIYNKPQPGLCSLLQVKDETAASELIRLKMKEAGLAINFAGLGLKKDEIMDDLLNSVNEERFANNPVPFNRQKLKDLFTEYL